jgi:hypothetical protein
MLGALVGNALGVDVGVALGVTCCVGRMASSSGLQKESRTATQSALLSETRMASSWDTAACGGSDAACGGYIHNYVHNQTLNRKERLTLQILSLKSYRLVCRVHTSKATASIAEMSQGRKAPRRCNRPPQALA